MNGSINDLVFLILVAQHKRGIILTSMQDLWAESKITAAIRAPKAAMLIAHRIVADIDATDMRVGDHLPPERIMLEHYQTGRGTLREALRFLEFQGVLALKPGPRGGPVLLKPDATHLASTVVLLMQMNRAPFREIVQVRSAIEPMISMLAAGKMMGKDLESLHDTITQMRENLENQEVFLDANKRFHDIIAWSSGNVLFGYLVDSLLEIMDGTIVGIDYPPHRREAIVNAHEDIFQAFAAKDPEAARSRMQSHINAYEDYVTRKFPNVLNEVIPWRTF
jgi:DNA-binding FadR family transcriptional regulator